MITAVDTNVLVDVLAPQQAHLEASRHALRQSAERGRLIACEVVWAEVASLFDSVEDARTVLGVMGVDFSPVGDDEALLAGRAWAEYRRRGGARTRMVADFLIGAHAEAQADRLLTRDRGFFRSYFQDLAVLDPSE